MEWKIYNILFGFDVVMNIDVYYKRDMDWSQAHALMPEGQKAWNWASILYKEG